MKSSGRPVWVWNRCQQRNWISILAASCHQHFCHKVLPFPGREYDLFSLSSNLTFICSRTCVEGTAGLPPALLVLYGLEPTTANRPSSNLHFLLLQPRHSSNILRRTWKCAAGTGAAFILNFSVKELWFLPGVTELYFVRGAGPYFIGCHVMYSKGQLRPKFRLGAL